jgi:F0F1-type ATP synthase assembly protein I
LASQSPNWTTFLGMGAATAAQLVAGLLLGLLVDSLAGTAPVFLLLGLLLGIVAAVYYVIVQFRSLTKD